ncbi:hypothetical protein M3J09_004752 [Ascochyta lentis]
MPVEELTQARCMVCTLDISSNLMSRYNPSADSVWQSESIVLMRIIRHIMLYII